MNIQKKAQMPGGENSVYGNNKARIARTPNKGNNKNSTALSPAVGTLKQFVTQLLAFTKRLPLKLSVHQDILAASYSKKAIQRFLAWRTSQTDYPRSPAVGVLHYDLYRTPAHSAHLRGQFLREINHDRFNQLIQLHLSKGATNAQKAHRAAARRKSEVIKQRKQRQKASEQLRPSLEPKVQRKEPESHQGKQAAMDRLAKAISNPRPKLTLKKKGRAHHG